MKSWKKKEKHFWEKLHIWGFKGYVGCKNTDNIKRLFDMFQRSIYLFKITLLYLLIPLQV